jgi:hypothetical protein
MGSLETLLLGSRFGRNKSSDPVINPKLTVVLSRVLAC